MNNEADTIFNLIVENTPIDSKEIYKLISEFHDFKILTIKEGETYERIG